MRLVVEMRKLALLLPYETVDECQSGTGTTDIEGAARAQSLTALGSASVENVSFTLDVFPDSLALDAALGNLVALYEVGIINLLRIPDNVLVGNLADTIWILRWVSQLNED
jgi:hypothetical protein